MTIGESGRAALPVPLITPYPEAAMALSLHQLEVTTFDTMPASYNVSPNQPYTPPVANCYSPLCMPTALPEQCPETTTQQTVIGAE
jgi:hypothetical protein